jgi:hypothetical protein
MSTNKCTFCGSVLYGRTDKRYCSSTCRRDASRVRKRTIRFGDYTFFGSELRQSDSIEEVLIPRLEREHGPHHRLVHEARRHAEQLREAEIEKLARAMRRVDLSWSREVAKVQADRDRIDSSDPPPS